MSSAAILVAVSTLGLQLQPAAAQQPPPITQPIQPSTKGRLDTKMHGYDMIVAVTQNNINAHFKLLYGREGGIKTTFEIKNKRLGELEATIGPPTVRLNAGSDPRKVVFTLNLKKGKLRYYADDQTDTLSELKISNWDIGIISDLRLEDLDEKRLPPEVMQTLKRRLPGGQIDPSMFSFRQLLMHFQNVLKLDSYVTRFPTEVADPKDPSKLKDPVQAGSFNLLMQQHIETLKKNGQNILGYAISTKNPNVVEPQAPTFPPTDVTYTTNLYLPDGNYKPDRGSYDPGLDTLCYLLMTNNRQFPPELARSVPPWFGNWVNAKDQYGSIAIAKRVFVDEFLLKALAKATTIKGSALPFSNKEAKPFGALKFGLSSQSDVGKGEYVADSSSLNVYHYSHTYDHPEEQFDGPGYAVDVRLKMTNSAKVVIEPRGKKIDVSGSFVMRLDFTHWHGYRNASAPTKFWRQTTLPWSLPLELRGVKDGGLKIDVSTPSIGPAKPEEGGDWLAELAREIGNAFKVPMDNCNAVMTRDLTRAIQNARLDDRAHEVLNSCGAFVFPGGDEFLMYDPVFNEELDLLAYIKYNFY